MSGLDFDDIHGDIAPALAEMSRPLRVVPMHKPSDGFNKWHPLPSAYFDPADLHTIARAQSIVRSELGYTPTLTAEEARTILAEHEVKA